MTKKIYNDSLFILLDWILKKKSKGNGDLNSVSPFIINRWLSMADPNIAQMVNVTTNRWLMSKSDFISSNDFMGIFFKTILPKFNKKIVYIKSPPKTKTNEDYLSLASAFECSTKEIELYEKTLAEINEVVK